MYGLNDPPFTVLAGDAIAQNTAKIAARAQSDIERTEALLNLQYRFGCHFVGVLVNLVAMTPLDRLRFSAFHKNLVAVFACLQLARSGLHGSTGPMLRHAFESLMLAKFCSIRPDEALASRWLNGEIIYLGNTVLRKIRQPDPAPFWEVWGMLSDQAHSTIYSQQVAFDVDKEQRDVLVTFALMQMLLECNYHLLSSHLFTSRLEYYARAYIDPYGIPELRVRAKELHRQCRSRLGKSAVKFISAYKSGWHVAP